MKKIVSFVVSYPPLQRLMSDQRGVSAVEFALLLPLMLVLYIGGTEASQAISADRKVTITAHTVADLAAQSSQISASDMTNILDASTAVIAPFDPGKLAVTISSVKIDAKGNATIVWSASRGGAKHAVGDPVQLPGVAVAIPNSYLLWGEVAYSYTPPIGYTVLGSFKLKDQMFMRPRVSDSVGYTPTS